MFEDDLCLSCGKVVDTGRAYCNSDCQNGDLTSPSLSSASSAFSSPHLQYANGQDVPALVPSALGRALRAYTAHDRYSASSSDASSTAWSLTDDDDSSEFDDNRDQELLYPQHALSYARRPSGTNTRSTFPRLLHCRTPSFEASCPPSSSSLPQSAPGDVPAHRFLDDDLDADLSDFASEVASEFASEDPARPRTSTLTKTAPAGTGAVKRKRTNRASLPAYFSMLQVDSAPTASAATAPQTQRTSPVSSSSVHTVLAAVAVAGTPARPSPPTPKLSLMAGLAAQHRGRRPPSHPHQSRSPSPARRRDSDEKVADWSSALALTRERGRAVRRNSSSSPPVLAPPPLVPRSSSRGRSGRSGSASGSGDGSRARTRGRARVEELAGPRSPAHPGFGFGRSGLVGRARRGVGDEWVGVGGAGGR
ncbi:hypothetical protein C8R46DRAFT_140898 [Mycena filopes]|nr:hypothetical protein C8R46DRAFT_140898 [Mycena filopes]